MTSKLYFISMCYVMLYKMCHADAMLYNMLYNICHVMLYNMCHVKLYYIT